jgi:signal transduction histidine kinase
MGIEVTYPSHTSDWPELKIDANRIKEVFMVILENAVRYNFKNGKINIETKTTGDNFEMKIFNTGIGLTLDENKQLFNRSFYRSKIAKELNPIGMGIGLSLSRSIVEAHHGTLEISSKGINMGVTVNITLPTDFLVKYS